MAINSNPYPQFFQNLLLGGLREIKQRLQTSELFTPEEAREHAWHLLSVAFDTHLHPSSGSVLGSVSGNADIPVGRSAFPETLPASPDIWTLARDLLLELAPKMEQAGFREKWLPYLLRGSEVGGLYGDAKAEADCKLHIGLLYRLLSEFEPARQWLLNALQQFIDLSDGVGQARTLNQLAYVVWHQNQFDVAETDARRALSLLDEDSLEAATSLSLLGLIAGGRRQWQEAEAFHRRALHIRQTQGDARTAAWSLQNLGFALSGQKLYDEARTCYQSAIATLDDLQDFMHSAIARMNLGIVYYYTKDYQAALAIYSQAEAVFQRVKNTHELARTYNNKALCYLQLAEWSAAIQFFEESAQLARTIGNWVEWADVMDGLGEAYLGRGDYCSAREVLQATLAEFSSHCNPTEYPALVSTLTKHLQEATARLSELENT